MCLQFRVCSFKFFSLACATSLNIRCILAPDELDSFMYQTVGHQGVSLYAEAMGLPLFRQYTSGVAHHQDKWYTPTVGDEVEDLYKLLQKVKVSIIVCVYMRVVCVYAYMLCMDMDTKVCTCL